MACYDPSFDSDNDSDGFDDAQEAFDNFLPACQGILDKNKTFDNAQQCLEEAKQQGLDVKVQSITILLATRLLFLSLGRAAILSEILCTSNIFF